jgi:hypothetical protein
LNRRRRPLFPLWRPQPALRRSDGESGHF